MTSKLRPGIGFAQRASFQTGHEGVNNGLGAAILSLELSGEEVSNDLKVRHGQAFDYDVPLVMIYYHGRLVAKTVQFGNVIKCVAFAAKVERSDIGEEDFRGDKPLPCVFEGEIIVTSPAEVNSEPGNWMAQLELLTEVLRNFKKHLNRHASNRVANEAVNRILLPVEEVCDVPHGL